MSKKHLTLLSLKKVPPSLKHPVPFQSGLKVSVRNTPLSPFTCLVRYRNRTGRYIYIPVRSEIFLFKYRLYSCFNTLIYCTFNMDIFLVAGLPLLFSSLSSFAAVQDGSRSHKMGYISFIFILFLYAFYVLHADRRELYIIERQSVFKNGRFITGNGTFQ
jgi:hypothetical protein